jgi:hypothetical protein
MSPPRIADCLTISRRMLRGSKMSPLAAGSCCRFGLFAEHFGVEAEALNRQGDGRRLLDRRSRRWRAVNVGFTCSPRDLIGESPLSWRDAGTCVRSAVPLGYSPARRRRSCCIVTLADGRDRARASRGLGRRWRCRNGVVCWSSEGAAPITTATPRATPSRRRDRPRPTRMRRRRHLRRSGRSTGEVACGPHRRY